MKKTVITALILTIAIVMIFSGTALAGTGKEKGKGKGKRADKVSNDPYKGRVGIGFSVGGSSGPGGFGFFGGVGVSYYFIKYVSANATVGYGVTPYLWTDSNGDEEKVSINYVPADLSVHIHPMPLSKISPYFGPGVGITYTWYEFDKEDYEQTWYSAFAEAGVTYWMSRNFGLNLGARYSFPYYKKEGDDEAKFHEGQLTFGMSGSIIF